MTEPQLLNLTPHMVTLITPEGHLSIPPSNSVARIELRAENEGYLTIRGAAIPLVSTRPEKITGLPDPKPNTFYIVSRTIAEALPERRDLLVPDELVRDSRQRIVGARRLARLKKGER
ncbi:MAG: hypothetical protein JRI39_00380 [Deltaproteobacteria bacterium]|nr:hypothetical protein [Deltaproteobacteria bacterium]